MFNIRITRRQFLKWLSVSAAALGLSQTDLLKIEKALAAGPTPDPNMPAGTYLRVIWIAGAACSGCPTSLLNYIADPADTETVLNAIANNASIIPNPTPPPATLPILPVPDIEALYPVSFPVPPGDIDIAEVVLEIVTIDYAQIVAAAAGDTLNQHLLNVLTSGAHYVLMTEGSIQTAANGKFCRVMDIPGQLPAGIWDTAAGGPYVSRYNDPDLGWRTDITMAGACLWLASQPQCDAVIALGTCASYGGVPGAYGSVTGVRSTWELLNKDNGLGKIVLNVPGCPPHPDWFVASAGAAILELSGIIPGILLNNLDTSLDHKNRPKNTYAPIYHNNNNYVFCQDCPRIGTKPGQNLLCAATGNECLEKRGCNGYLAGPRYVRADCPTRKWNNHTNWCVGNNYPCQGCTDPGFPDMSSPFFLRTKYL